MKVWNPDALEILRQRYIRLELPNRASYIY